MADNVLEGLSDTYVLLQLLSLIYMIIDLGILDYNVRSFYRFHCACHMIVSVDTKIIVSICGLLPTDLNVCVCVFSRVVGQP